jgi:hypothetical protein
MALAGIWGIGLRVGAKLGGTGAGGGAGKNHHFNAE